MQAEVLAEERDREILNIVKSINDLATIMKDLSLLVIDQGTLLDRIDYNMEQVAKSVEEGVVELQKAEKKQKQSQNAMIIMWLVALVSAGWVKWSWWLEREKGDCVGGRTR